MQKSNLSRKMQLAWVTLAVGVLASVVAAMQVKQGIEREVARQFAFNCDQVALKVHERLRAYALILRGGAGLFAASRTVERNQWRAYVETLWATGSVPGVQGIGFAEVIPPGQLAAHVERIRAQGFPDYRVRPPGERALYTAIIYLEPFRDRNLRAFGYDMYSEPVRRAAMEHARDTGDAALSGKVELVQEIGTQIQAGTLMYVPVYRNGAPVDTLDERRTALIGWSYSPYRMNDLMTGILGDWEAHEGKTVDLHIYDGPQAAPATLLFDSKPTFDQHINSPSYQQRTLDFGDRHWLLVFDRPAIASTDSAIGYAPWTTLAGGLVLSGLLFGLMRSVFNTRADAIRIAAALTAEIRQGQKLLQESHAQVSLLLDSATEAIYGIDMDGNCTFCNDACLRLLGYQRPEELLGKHMHRQIHAKHADGTPFPAAECRIMQAIRNGEALHVDDEVLWRRDGTAFPVEYWSAPQRHDGAIVGAVVSFLDLTERKQLERMIANSRNVLLTVIDNAPLRVFWKDRDLRYLGCNFAFARDAGMTHPRDLIGKDDYQMGWAAQADRYRADDRAVIASGIAKSLYDEPQTTPDGQTIWLRTSKVPLRNQDGEVFGLLGVYEDITERRQIEQALRISEERLSIITASAQDAIIMLDAAGDITFWNAAATTIFGYTRDEVLGRNLHAILAPQSFRETQRLAFPHFQQTGQGDAVGRTIELTGLRKDGSEFPLALSLSAARLADAWHAIGIVRDVTELKRMQDQLAQRASEMRTTLYGIGHAVISLDNHGRVLLMNPMAETLTGWQESHAHGKPLDEVFCIVDEKTGAKVDNPIALTSHQLGITDLARRTLLIARDGAARTIGGSAAPILDQDGNLIRMVLVFRDLTEERKAADIIRNQLAIIESYEGLVLLADLEGQLIYINAGGIKMLGAAQADEILARNITDLLPQTNVQHINADLIPAAFANGVCNGESMLQRLDGTGIPVAHTLFPIRDDEGNPRHIGAIIMDISLQKEMQARLMVAEKLAAMARLLGDVSHEINNPLATVIGRTELILSDLEEQQSPLRDDLETVLRSAQRCNTVLGNLLAYSVISEPDEGKTSQMTNEGRISK